MLSKLNLENFKSFKNLNNLKIKPITILCGANSCGKSSILQSLLLLKQTKESRNPNQSLLLNGKYVHLGDIENIIYGKEKKKVLSLCYQYEFTTEQFYQNRAGRRPSIFYLFRYLLTEEVRRIKHAKYSISFGAKIKVSNKSKGYIKSSDIQNYSISLTTHTPDGKIIPGAIIEIKKNNDQYSLAWKNIHHPHLKKEEITSGSISGLIVTFENLFPIFDFKTVRDDDNLFEKIPIPVRNFVRATDDFLINANEGLTYVGPLREEPSRRYIYENEVIDIGSKGENAAYIYQTEQDTIINSHFFYNKERDDFNDTTSLSLKDALSKWLDLMKIKGFSPDHQSEIIRLNMDANSSSKTRVNIADVGFGVSQIFPILLEGLRMQKNGTLLLEQPEIHLHPNLQMQMADYFLSLAMSGKNVIIETHSDHIINRLVRRIIEDDQHQLDKMIAIYFVSNGADGSTIEEVIIDPRRGIVNWPQDFFDQTASEQEKIMMAGIKKRKTKGSDKI